MHYALRITHFRSAYFVFIGLLIAFTSSCAPATPVSQAILSPKRTLPPTRTQTLTPTPTLLPAPTITTTPTENRSSPDEDKLKIGPCSPLAVLSLAEIPTYITQPFIPPSIGHNAEHPDWVQKDDGHHGTDIGYYKLKDKLFTGTPVLAVLSGQIAGIAHDRPPYGNMLMVETPFVGIPPTLIAGQKITSGDSLYTLYAHLQNLQALTIGQPVTCGQQLAETGLTGFTGGPHLHFETRWGPPGQTFTSMAYYRADASAEEMRNYETWRMTAVFHLFDSMQLLQTSNVRP